MQVARHADGRRVRAMRGCCRTHVVDVDVAALGEFAEANAGSSGFFLSMKADVLELHEAAVRDVARRRHGRGADTIVDERHRHAEAFAQPRRHRPERVLRIGLAVGTAQVREDDRLRTALRAATAASSSDAVMIRVSSPTAPSFIGTLRSSRSSTRLPRTSPASRSVRNVKSDRGRHLLEDHRRGKASARRHEGSPTRYRTRARGWIKSPCALVSSRVDDPEAGAGCA